jgi:hypothetical protein
MSYNTGTNDQVNGGSKAGEFLTGKMDFFTVKTVVPMAQTNVTTPVAYLYTQQGYSTWQPVTVINGAGTPVTYSTEASYVDALIKQANLNLLIQLFAIRANPVAISVSTVSENPNTSTYAGYLNATNLGSDFNGTYTVTTVKFATEKTLLWNVSTTADSNALGYQLLTALDGIAVQDLASPVGVTAFVVDGSANDRNVIAIRSTSL